MIRRAARLGIPTRFAQWAIKGDTFSSPDSDVHWHDANAPSVGIAGYYDIAR